MARLLKYFVEWIEEEGAAGTGSKDKDGQRALALPPSVAAWIFALLARLDKPTPPDVASALRQLLRFCCKLRASLQPGDAEVAPANVLIVVVVEVFGQATAEERGDLLAGCGGGEAAPR